MSVIWGGGNAAPVDRKTAALRHDQNTLLEKKTLALRRLEAQADEIREEVTRLKQEKEELDREFQFNKIEGTQFEPDVEASFRTRRRDILEARKLQKRNRGLSSVVPNLRRRT